MESMLKQQLIIHLDTVDAGMKILRKTLADMDGRKTEVKEMRKAVFIILDEINKCSRILEEEDE
jgi:hypothetical protein